MCELFPTEVSCFIKIGATTGAIDRSNYLCILSNNLFNQKYFLVLWLWWMFLVCVSILGLIYRLARINVPDLSRGILMRKVQAWRLENLELSSSEYFVLDMLSDNLPHTTMDLVLEEIGNYTVPNLIENMNTDNLNQAKFDN